MNSRVKWSNLKKSPKIFSLINNRNITADWKHGYVEAAFDENLDNIKAKK